MTSQDTVTNSPAARRPADSYRYQLLLDSDGYLLIGGSYGHPERFDRASVLDENGMPFVPTSSLAGRVKQKLRELLRENRDVWPEVLSLCEGQEAGLSRKERYCPEDPALRFPPCALCRLFGAPGGIGPRAAWGLSGAYYAPEDALRYRAVFGPGSDAVLTGRVRNTRDRARRRAKEDHLFTDGVAEVLFPLHGQLWETPFGVSQYTEAERQCHRRLYLIGLRLVTDIGAVNNRGYGSCEILPDCGPAGPDFWQEEIKAFARDWESAIARREAGRTA